jgi:hypothetical protein
MARLISHFGRSDVISRIVPYLVPFLLISLFGCSSSAEFPTGTYEYCPGQNVCYEMTLSDDGQWTYDYPGTYVTGTYSIEGNQFIWETDSACATIGQQATYTWTAEDETLTFQLVGEDECVARRNVIDNRTYTKKS